MQTSEFTLYDIHTRTCIIQTKMWMMTRTRARHLHMFLHHRRNQKDKLLFKIISYEYTNRNYHYWANRIAAVVFAHSKCFCVCVCVFACAVLHRFYTYVTRTILSRIICALCAQCCCIARISCALSFRIWMRVCVHMYECVCVLLCY